MASRRSAPTEALVPSEAVPAFIGAEASRERLLEAHQRLCREYGCPIAYFHDHDPLSELVSALLSHRTKNADSGRAFARLRDEFAGWREVMEAPVERIESAIAAVTWPEQKAPRLQAVLRRIEERTGSLNLDFLGAMPSERARAWLQELPGVGPKTSAAVLSFSNLRGRALPVDSHHHRVATRLGVLPPGMPVGPSHAWMEAMLPDSWNAQEVYDHHEALMLHGQRVCYHFKPACQRCVLSDFCPSSRLGGAAN